MPYTDLATSWEPSGIQMVVPSEDRDFSRPKEPFYAQSVSVDSNMADDIKDIEKKIDPKIDSKIDPKIKSFQELLSQNLPVVGRLYQGPIDGIPNQQLSQACQSIEGRLSKLLGISVAGMIYNPQNKNFNVTIDDLKKSLQTVAQHLSKLEEKNQEKTNTVVDKTARFQALFKIYKNM